MAFNFSTKKQLKPFDRLNCILNRTFWHLLRYGVSKSKTLYEVVVVRRKKNVFFDARFDAKTRENGDSETALNV